MIGEPRWFAHAPTKPGYGEPEPMKPAQTMDSPENVDICLNCKLPSCRTGSPACLLYGKGSRRSREAIKAELAARVETVRVLLEAGWKGKGIRMELGITESALKESKRRLRERGEIK